MTAAARAVAARVSAAAVREKAEAVRAWAAMVGEEGGGGEISATTGGVMRSNGRSWTHIAGHQSHQNHQSHPPGRVQCALWARSAPGHRPGQSSEFSGHPRPSNSHQRSFSARRTRVKQGRRRVPGGIAISISSRGTAHPLVRSAPDDHHRSACGSGGLSSAYCITG